MRIRFPLYACMLDTAFNGIRTFITTNFTNPHIPRSRRAPAFLPVNLLDTYIRVFVSSLGDSYILTIGIL